MANSSKSILERYGVKEVCDVTFYTIEADGSMGKPVLYIDTAKTSTAETTAETTYAQGGKGNPRLIGWDYGKEITITLEDALFSPKSMALMYGDIDRTVKGTAGTFTITKTMNFIRTSATTQHLFGDTDDWTDANGNKHTVKNLKFYSQLFEDKTASPITSIASLNAGYEYLAVFEVEAANAMTIDVGPSTFPGTYYITMDTYARSERTGSDEYFQIVIPKGKITSENTLTMEAEGDPSVFNMNIDVLRATEHGKNIMMKMIKYDFGEGTVDNGDITIDWD